MSKTGYDHDFYAWTQAQAMALGKWAIPERYLSARYHAHTTCVRRLVSPD
jgi:hypothetical protein